MGNKEQYINDLMQVLQKSYGIILSYGESQDLIPVGTFGVARFLNVNKTPYSTDMKTVEKTDDILVELGKVDFDNGEVIYKSNEAVYMPLKDFLKVSKLGDNNSENLYSGYGVEPYMDVLRALEEVLSEELINNSNLTPADTYSLDDVNATYISNGEVRGTNYSVAPYSLGAIKRLEKTLDYGDREKTQSYGRSR